MPPVCACLPPDSPDYSGSKGQESFGRPKCRPPEITSRPAGATPTITELRQGRVAGGFAEPVRLALARDPALAAEIARRILNAHFPESIRQDAADAVGLSLDAGAGSMNTKAAASEFSSGSMSALPSTCAAILAT